MTAINSDSDLRWAYNRKRRLKIKNETPEEREDRLAKRRERGAAYRAAHREEVRAYLREYGRAWRELNRDKVREQSRRHKAKRRAAKVAAEAERERAEIERKKELRRAQQRRYYARHKEKCAQMTKAWLARNPDYQRQADRDRYMLDPEKKKAAVRVYRERRRLELVTNGGATQLK